MLPRVPAAAITADDERRRTSLGIEEGDVEHPSELAGVLDVASGVRHGASRHCRWSVFRLLELSRDVESVRKLVGLDPTRHFTRERERESFYSLECFGRERERVVARVGVSVQ